LLAMNQTTRASTVLPAVALYLPRLLNQEPFREAPGGDARTRLPGRAVVSGGRVQARMRHLGHRVQLRAEPRLLDLLELTLLGPAIQAANDRRVFREVDQRPGPE